MKRFHIAIANIIFGLHILLGLAIVFGWLFSEIKILYLLLLIGWILSWIVLGYCPFTKLEFALRRKYKKEIGKNTEFVRYYMYKFFKKDFSSRALFTTGIILFFVFITLTFVIH